jgi:uncharacterized protein (DUF302 family)
MTNSTSISMVDHVRWTTTKPFEAVRADFERELGRVDAEAYQASLAGGDAEAARATIEAMAGPSGFMLFATHDHGSLLGLVGPRRQALQYILGNPLFAVEMTRHAIAASLYAPLRVLLYENEEGASCIEYDRPSSLFGQFGDDRIGRVAASLDQKLESLAATAIR